MTPWTAAHQTSRSFPISQSSLKLVSMESVTPSNHLILCRPLLLLPSVFPSIRAFPNESALRIRRPKYWSFSFSISPSSDDSGLICFRTDPEQNYTLSSILFLLQGILFPLCSKTSLQTNSDKNRAFIQAHQCWKAYTGPQPSSMSAQCHLRPLGPRSFFSLPDLISATLQCEHGSIRSASLKICSNIYPHLKAFSPYLRVKVELCPLLSYGHFPITLLLAFIF